jgi:serine/threonine-protein kinase RIO1
VALEEAAFTRARKEGWQLPLPIAVTDAVEVMATIGDD